jgi:hypothetical protein
VGQLVSRIEGEGLVQSTSKTSRRTERASPSRSIRVVESRSGRVTISDVRSATGRLSRGRCRRNTLFCGNP